MVRIQMMGAVLFFLFMEGISSNIVTVNGIVGEDTTSCGKESQPCKTIRKGVSRIVHKGDSGTGSGMVRVVGGQTYLNECSADGIFVPAGSNLSVIGEQGVPTIDCERRGRLFLVAVSQPAPAPCDVTIEGTTNPDALRYMGEYKLLPGVTSNNRPVYQRLKDYLYGYQDSQTHFWIIGPTVGDSPISSVSYTPDDATLPQDIRGNIWLSRLNTAFTGATVACAAAPCDVTIERAISPDTFSYMEQYKLMSDVPCSANEKGFMALESLRIVNSEAGNGGAVKSVGGNLKVHDCSFEHDKTTGFGKLDPPSGGSSAIFRGGGGGALYVEAGTLTVTNSSFLLCSAPLGGGGAILVVNHEIIGNSKSWTTLLHISNTNFTSCEAGSGTLSSVGGAVALINYQSAIYAMVVLTSNRFFGNRVSSTNSQPTQQQQSFVYGGGMYIWNGGYLIRNNYTFHDCEWTSNELLPSIPNGYARGGGLHFELAKDTHNVYNSVLFHGCSFKSHSFENAGYGYCEGGGLYLYFSSFGENTVALHDCLFLSNNIRTSSYGYARGGGAYLTISSSSSSDYKSPLELYNCHFENNYATASSFGDAFGGGLYLYKDQSNRKDIGLCPVLLQTCSFRNNEVRGANCCQGGGMYFSFGYSSELTASPVSLLNCIFEQNSAGTSGGGLYFSPSKLTPSPVSLLNCIFEQNSAGTSGGGLCISNMRVTSLVDCSFILNIITALDSQTKNCNGGGLSVSGGHVNLTSTTFLKNVLNAKTVNSVAFQGAGAFVDGTVSGVNVNFSSNYMRFERGAAAGAGMYVSGTADFLSANFSNNSILTLDSGSGKGGGLHIFVQGGQTASVHDTYFENNTIVATTSARGGGLSLEFPASLTTENAEVCVQLNHFISNRIVAVDAQGGGASVASNYLTKSSPSSPLSINFCNSSLSCQILRKATAVRVVDYHLKLLEVPS